MLHFHGCLKETVKPSLRLDSFFVFFVRFEFPKLEMFAEVLPFLSQETIKVQIKYILKP